MEIQATVQGDILSGLGFCPWRQLGCQGTYSYWRSDKARTCRNSRCRRAYYRAMRARKPANVERAKRLVSDYHQRELLDRWLERFPPEKRRQMETRLEERLVRRCMVRMKGCKGVVFLRKKRNLVCANPKCQNRYWTNQAREARRLMREMDDL